MGEIFLRFCVDAIHDWRKPRKKKTLLCNPFKFHGGRPMPFLNHHQYSPLQIFLGEERSSDTKCLVGKGLFITVKVSYVIVPVASRVGYIS